MALRGGQILTKEQRLEYTAINELRKSKVILPGMTTIELLVWESRKTAEEKIFNIINS